MLNHKDFVKAVASAGWSMQKVVKDTKRKTSLSLLYNTNCSIHVTLRFLLNWGAILVVTRKKNRRKACS